MYVRHHFTTEDVHLLQASIQNFEFESLLIKRNKLQQLSNIHEKYCKNLNQQQQQQQNSKQNCTSYTTKGRQRTMPPKKPPAPAVVSTGCSGLMSCLSLRRTTPPPQQRDKALLQPRLSDGDVAAEQYWKRVQLLEEEIKKLGKWLGQEEKLTECVKNGKAREEIGSTTKRCTSVDHINGGNVQEMVRLEDGSYLHEIRMVGRPWGRLAMQVAQPIVADNVASVSEVLDKMTMTSMEYLCKSLVEMMPMKGITDGQKPGKTIHKTAKLNSGDDFLEAVLFKAMDKMEGLVLEGLKIQMGSANDSTATTATDEKREETVNKDCMVHVVLIQARDPKEGYGAIGEPMIGLVEASLKRKDGKVKLEIQGLHIAGISSTSRKRSDGRGVLWSASLRHCRESHSSSDGGGVGGCRCSYVRNANRTFLR